MSAAIITLDMYLPTTRAAYNLIRQYLVGALILIFVGFHATSRAQEHAAEPIIVTTRVDEPEITIGDTIKYTISVNAIPSVKAELPEFGENLGGFAIKDFGQVEPKRREGRIVFEQWYILDTYTTGSYTIPAPVVRYTDAAEATHEIEGEEIRVEVKSVLSDGDAPKDIKDIAAPAALPVSYRELIFWLVAATAFIVAGIVIFLYFRRRRLKQEITLRRPPHEIAYERLEALIASQLIEQRRIEEYYVSISGTIRAYLENQFGLKAPEMTTEEFLEAAARESNLKDEHKTLLNRFLMHCDLVKFARYGPDELETQSAYDSAKLFVDETALFFADEEAQ